MFFTIEEIRGYLTKQDDLKSALDNLSKGAIVEAIPFDQVNSLNYEKTEKNLYIYEEKIGMKRRKDEQAHLHRSTQGDQGRYWMACSPRWFENEEEIKKYKSKYAIAYWVNYGDNQTYGLFTVEQIRQWFDDPKIKLYEIGGTKER